MKRSKAFFKSVLKANKERMLATFDRAKKHTQSMMQRNVKRNEKSLLIILWNIYYQKIRTVLYSASAKSRTYIRQFSLRDTYRNISVFFTKTLNRMKDTSFAIYENVILRGKYTHKMFMILFLVAIVFGIGVKSLAVNIGMTMGFDDYLVISEDVRYDIGLLQEKNMNQTKEDSESNERQGDVCSDLEI
ncbi:MAG: hypothetical protein PHH40_01030 [Candidatus Moranbacteria bacterium]|nr:hypothetical protein [Candidatus Moranbacteria bacterium]MDD3964898.1 hypothetical protein [Candidatus Moranbacteria bacterium]